jgi:KDO2-lipid IV(A) lauroyltransferase
MGDWKGMGIYKQLSNKYFDKLMVESRGRFGIELCSTKNVSNYFETHKDERIAYGFLADQNPRDKNNAYWIDFFGVHVPWAMGAEKYARQYNMPVLYGDSIKIKRGYYKLEYSLITNNPSELAEGEITKLFAKKLEESILKDKPSWLWTHKRWKHAERK